MLLIQIILSHLLLFLTSGYFSSVCIVRVVSGGLSILLLVIGRSIGIFKYLFLYLDWHAIVIR